MKRGVCGVRHVIDTGVVPGGDKHATFGVIDAQRSSRHRGFREDPRAGEIRDIHHHKTCRTRCDVRDVAVDNHAAGLASGLDATQDSGFAGSVTSTVTRPPTPSATNTVLPRAAMPHAFENPWPSRCGRSCCWHHGGNPQSFLVKADKNIAVRDVHAFVADAGFLHHGKLHGRFTVGDIPCREERRVSDIAPVGCVDDVAVPCQVDTPGSPGVARNGVPEVLREIAHVFRVAVSTMPKV